MMFNFYWKTKH